MSSGTDVAIETADVVLMKATLQDVITALHLSRVVMRRIRLNFVWAFGYNLVGIPLAAGLLYPCYGIQLPPMFAGAPADIAGIAGIAGIAYGCRRECLWLHPHYLWLQARPWRSPPSRSSAPRCCCAATARRASPRAGRWRPRSR